MKIQRERRRPMAEINVVPYIDVMLVLLVIFMITAPLLNQGINVDLPQAKAQTLPPQEKEPVVVSVDAKGLYYLNIATDPESPLSAEEILKRVSAELHVSKQQGGQQRAVLVKGDKNVDYGHVVQAMILLQQAGAASVGLMTGIPESHG